MHIMTHGQVKRIAGLVGIHHMLVVLQSQRVAFGIVEREIYIVCEVSEDNLQVTLQCRSHLQVGLRAQLCLEFSLQLSGHIGH